MIREWQSSYRADWRALPLADRHYNREKPGTPQFVPPGRCVVLLTPAADALWVTSWPLPEYTKHAWPGAWICSLFRNESAFRSSDLIREAVAITRFHFGAPPALGMVTFVDPNEVTSPNPGYCFLCAGFTRLRERTKVRGYQAFQLLPEHMPSALPPSDSLFSLLEENAA